MARNVARERGVDYDKEFNNFKQMFRNFLKNKKKKGVSYLGMFNSNNGYSLSDVAAVTKEGDGFMGKWSLVDNHLVLIHVLKWKLIWRRKWSINS